MDNKSLGVVVLVAVLVVASGGVAYFLYQQFQERRAEQARALAAREQQTRGLSDFSKACADLGTAAAVMKKEVNFYLENISSPKVSGRDVTNVMEKYLQQLIEYQGISADLTPAFGLTFEPCASPPTRDGSLEAGFRASLARAECEVTLCNKMRDEMSRLAK